MKYKEMTEEQKEFGRIIEGIIVNIKRNASNIRDNGERRTANGSILDRGSGTVRGSSDHVWIVS